MTQCSSFWITNFANFGQREWTPFVIKTYQKIKKVKSYDFYYTPAVVIRLFHFIDIEKFKTIPPEILEILDFLDSWMVSLLGFLGFQGE